MTHAHLDIYIDLARSQEPGGEVEYLGDWQLATEQVLYDDSSIYRYLYRFCRRTGTWRKSSTLQGRHRRHAGTEIYIYIDDFPHCTALNCTALALYYFRRATSQVAEGPKSPRAVRPSRSEQQSPSICQPHLHVISCKITRRIFGMKSSQDCMTRYICIHLIWLNSLEGRMFGWQPMAWLGRWPDHSGILAIYIYTGHIYTYILVSWLLATIGWLIATSWAGGSRLN